MDYKKLAADLLSGCEENCADCEYAGDSEFECTIAQLAATAITDLLARADAAEARVHELETTHRVEMCEDGYDCVELGKVRRKLEEAEIRAEKAEKEWRETVSLCGKLIALCSPPKEWKAKLFRRHINRPGDYMGSGYDFLDGFNRIYEEFVETADDEVYAAIREATEKEILERTRRMIGQKEK